MKIKKWQIAALIIVVLLIVVSGKKNAGVAVKEVELKNRVVKRTVSASGVVTSDNAADLGFSSIGRLSQITVEKGDAVTKGHYLAALESFPESQTTQATKDARDVANHDLDIYIENYSTNLSAVGGIDEYNLNVQRLGELAHKAEATYQASLGSLGRMYLYSPFEGTVIDVNKEVGETAGLTETIIKLADLNTLTFEISLDQEDFGFLELGQEVEITLDAYDGEVFKGTVNKLPSYVDSDTGNDFVIEIAITENENNKVLLGMTGDAFIVLSKTASPVSALTFDEVQYDIDDKPFVYVEADGKLKMEYIDIGLQGDIYTEVKSDIKNPIVKNADDKSEFEEGLKVKIDGQ